MNFWEYKEDNSRGYWLPTNDNMAYYQGYALGKGMFALVLLSFKLLFLIAKATAYLLYQFICLLLLIKK